MSACSAVLRLVCACALWALSAPSAQAQAPSKGDGSDRTVAQKVADYRRLLLAGGEQICPAEGSSCDVPITITQTTATDGSLYCLGTLIETIKVKGTKNTGGENNLTLNWILKLDSTIPARFTFEFQLNSGILVVDDPKGKMHSKARVSPMQFSFKNKRNKKPAEAVYLPVILQTETKDGGNKVVTLCAAADPKIVND